MVKRSDGVPGLADDLQGAAPATDQQRDSPAGSLRASQVTAKPSAQQPARQSAGSAGRAAAVLIGIDAYERREQEREILRLLARGEKEIGEEKGADLDAVFAEADAILSAD